MRCAECRWHIFHYTMFPTMIFILQYLYSKILALMYTFIRILLCHRLLFYITWQVDIYFKSFHLTLKLCMIMHVQISSFPILLCMVLTHFLFQPLLYRELYSFLFRLFAEIFICSCSWYCPLLLISLYQFHIISSCKHSHLSYFNNVCAQFAQLSIEP